MNKKIQKNKGFILKRILILIVLLLALGLLYSVFPKKSNNGEVSKHSIHLLSPNGGETLTMGATTTITFETTGEIKEPYQVVIWLDPSAAPLATIPANQTSYSFALPSSVLVGGDAVAPLEPGSYKIRIALYDGIPCTGLCVPSDVIELAHDASDAEINIVGAIASEATPVITSIFPNSAKVGAKIEIKGSNFSGFEGDTYAWIENSKGEKGIIYNDEGSTNNLIKFTLKDKYCTKDNSYSGEPCASYISMTPGTYSMYVYPWGKMSNKVPFTVTN